MVWSREDFEARAANFSRAMPRHGLWVRKEESRLGWRRERERRIGRGLTSWPSVAAYRRSSLSDWSSLPYQGERRSFFVIVPRGLPAVQPTQPPVVYLSARSWKSSSLIEAGKTQ